MQLCDSHIVVCYDTKRFIVHFSIVIPTILFLFHLQKNTKSCEKFEKILIKDRADSGSGIRRIKLFSILFNNMTTLLRRHIIINKSSINKTLRKYIMSSYCLRQMRKFVFRMYLLKMKFVNYLIFLNPRGWSRG